MKLHYVPPSPFARKTRLMVLEKGLEDRIEMVLTLPFGQEDDVRAKNPIGKIPFLERDDGPVLMDSTLICQYIDSLSEPRLIPQDGEADQWDILRLHSIANGVTEATMAIAVEGRREQAEGTPAARSPTFHARFVSSIKLGLDALEAETLTQDANIATLTIGTMLDYIDLRASQDVDWRDGHPNLVAWFEVFSKRPSMVATPPA